MKIKLLTSVLCVFLVFFALSGCGLKMPGSSDNTPSGDPSSSPTGDSISEATTVTGIVNFVDNGTIELDLVKQEDAPSVEPTQKLRVGSTVFVVTEQESSVNTDAGTAVVLENRGYITGALVDIAEGDFLAVVLRDNTAITILDGGPADAYFIDSEAPDPGDEPTNEPADDPTEDPTEDPEAGETAGVPDSSIKTVYTVITDGLKVRSGPATTNAVLGVLDTGARATGTVADGWLVFMYNGKPAYCSAQYLAVSTAPVGVADSTASKSYTTTDKLQARSGPGTTYASLGTIDKGTKVTGTVTDGWLKFTYNNKTAYCSAAYLSAG